MNAILCHRVLLLCLLSLLGTTLGLPGAEAKHGNARVSARVWEFDSKVGLEKMDPIVRLMQLQAPAFANAPKPQPALAGMQPHPILCNHAEAMKALRALEADFGAKGHPEVSRTVPLGQEVAFTIPFAAEKLGMRVLTALACRIRDEVALLISFPDSSRPVNPIMEVHSLRYSSEGQSYLLCRTETLGDHFHHTLILLEETHFGIAGKDPVTRTRNQLQRWILPETHLEPMTTLQFVEWLAQKTRKLDGPSRQGLNLVWVSEPLQSPDLSEAPHFFYKQTMHELFFHSPELSFDVAIEPHAVVFRSPASETECSSAQMRSRRFPVRPQFLERFRDQDAIHAAARASNIPIYEQGGFMLDRENLILTCRQIPEHFLRSEKWLRDQKLLDETPRPAPALPAALVKAGKIILPQLDLRRASLGEAVKAIQQAAAKADPPVKNLKIVVEPSTQEEHAITMFTRAIPLSEALRHCAELSYHRIEADDTTITLRALSQP